MKRLADKVAVLVGVGNGMGRATAMLFASEGAIVVMAARTLESMRETESIIHASGGKCECESADALDPDTLSALFDDVRARHGEPNVVYCGAGLFRAYGVKLADTTDDDLTGMLELNVHAPFNVARVAIPHLVEGGGGSLIFVTASEPGRMISNAAYAATKLAVEGIVKKGARDYKADNVRVNAVLAGMVPHRLHAMPVAPVRRHLATEGTPEDIAYAALYLASDESRWVTGSCLVVDGGLGY